MIINDVRVRVAKSFSPWFEDCGQLRCRLGMWLSLFLCVHGFFFFFPWLMIINDVRVPGQCHVWNSFMLCVCVCVAC